MPPSPAAILILLLVAQVYTSKIMEANPSSPHPSIGIPHIIEDGPDASDTSQIAPREQNSQEIHDQYIYCQNGFQRQVFPDVFRSNLRKNAERELLVETAYGFKMYVDAVDGTVSKIIANTGTWQPSMINIIGRLLKKGHNVLNVGSQSGLEALIMGKIIGETGKLFILEPYSYSYGLVVKNIELNNLANISQIYQYGASDEESKGIIKVNFGNTGGSQIFPMSEANMKSSLLSDRFINEKQEVRLNKIDSLLPKDVSINFALIDVEGMELKVLRGMKELIDRSPNLVIMSQWQYASLPHSNRTEAFQLLTDLVSRGYRIYSYVRNPQEKSNCQIGKFRQYKKLQTLFHIKMVDLFFFPKHLSPPAQD